MAVGMSSIVASIMAITTTNAAPTTSASVVGGDHGHVNGTPGGDSSGSEDGAVVALLRSALGRVRLEEDRATKAEIRASLMSLADPASALPVGGWVGG